MSHIFTILFSLLMVGLYSHYWYKHYIVKDGIGRLYLLTGCGTLATFFAIRAITYIVFDLGYLVPLQVNTVFKSSPFLLAIPALFMLGYDIINSRSK